MTFEIEEEEEEAEYRCVPRRRSSTFRNIFVRVRFRGKLERPIDLESVHNNGPRREMESLILFYLSRVISLKRNASES
jgi:hypothetical protein